MKNNPMRWLYIIIISIALIAITSILIVTGVKPKKHPDNSSVRYTDSSETDYTWEGTDYNEKQEPSTTTDPDADANLSPSSEPTPNSSTAPNSTTPSHTPTPQPTEHRCYHEEAGICWDDLENDAYSAGLYDHEYGYYGASYNEPDNCDAICRDILEDAYEEGWAD